MKNTPFMSFRFYTQTLQEMMRLLNFLSKHPEETINRVQKGKDFCEICFSSADGSFSFNPEKKFSIDSTIKKIREAGITFDYKVVSQSEDPNENYIMHGCTAQQYNLDPSESVNNTYQAIIFDIDDGAISLGWFDEPCSVEVYAYARGNNIYQSNVFLEVDALGDDCYEALDDSCYTVKIDDIMIAENVDDFHHMSDRQITEICCEAFESDKERWNRFKDFCVSMGYTESIPEDLEPSELIFKIIPFKGKKSFFAEKANNIFADIDNDEDDDDYEDCEYDDE